MVNCVLLDCGAFEELYEGAVLLGILSVLALIALIVIAWIHAGRRLDD